MGQVEEDPQDGEQAGEDDVAGALLVHHQILVCDLVERHAVLADLQTPGGHDANHTSRAARRRDCSALADIH